MTHVTHDEIPPFYDENSEILILGSMPSKKSREARFYYMHPQNRFWKVLEQIFCEEITDKKEFLTRHHIALWDVLASCDINASSDASIKNPIPNDIEEILNKSQIKQIFTTGRTSEKYYQKYIYPKCKKESICLLSTSPANCAVSMEKLTQNWQVIRKYLGKGKKA